MTQGRGGIPKGAVVYTGRVLLHGFFMALSLLRHAGTFGTQSRKRVPAVPAHNYNADIRKEQSCRIEQHFASSKHYR